MKKIDEASAIKQLDEQEQYWMNQLEQEEKLEQEIEENKKKIAERLLQEKASTFDIDGIKFRIGYRVDDEKDPNTLELVVANINYLRLVGAKNGTATRIRLDYVKEMSLESNLTAAVEAWIRQTTGAIKPEMME